MNNKKKIVLLGAGNIAHYLAPHLHGQQFEIIQIYSRKPSNAKLLADKINTTFTGTFKEIFTHADLYIIAVPDAAIETICENINFNNALIAHTSGSTPMNILQKYSENYGVLYPFQTFSKNTQPLNNDFPVFVEANNNRNYQLLTEYAGALSENIFPLDSRQRIMLHIAAVFACNFTNAMYAIAYEICKNNTIDFNWLKPLIAETANKINYLDPTQAQTGPAIRNDITTLSKHEDLLKQNPKLWNIYKQISDFIKNPH